MANTRTDVDYHTLMTASRDEAESLAGYLNEHGVFAFTQEDHAVLAASQDLDTDELIRTLKRTWRHFWDNSDSGLFGLPMFVKES